MAAGFKFQHFDLHQVQKGSTVVVELSTGANVRLMTSTALSNYKNNRKHQVAKGSGLVTRSPHRIAVPSTGHWHLTVDLMGLRATQVRTKVHTEPPPLPRAASARPASLSFIRHVPQAELTPDESGQTWDVFISHASEDKEEVAAPLRAALVARGLRVWLDATELRVGDSLRRKIDYGLAHSSFGVVIFSDSFFSKGWTQYELDGIVTRSVAGEQSLLPIWHNIDAGGVRAYSPSLADKVALSSSKPLEEIADEIAAVVGQDANG